LLANVGSEPSDRTPGSHAEREDASAAAEGV